MFLLFLQNGDTPFMIAQKLGMSQEMKWLVSHGAEASSLEMVSE